MRALLLLGVLLVLPQAASAQTNFNETRTVEFKYGWPGGLNATVEMNKVRVRSNGDTVRSGITYRMRTKPHAEGLLVSYDSFSVPNLENTGMSPVQVQELFGALLPNFIVSREGGLVRVVGIEAMKEIMDTMMAPAVGRVQDNPELQKMIATTTSEEALTNVIAQDWNAMVATWVDAEMRKGEVLESEAEEPIPIMPDYLMPMLYEFELIDFVPCTEVETVKRCVQVEVRSQPDADAIKAWVEQLIAMGGEESKDSHLESMNVQNQIVVVTDPRRLLPYHVSMAKTVSGTGIERGQRIPFGSYERKTYKFTYHQAPR